MANGKISTEIKRELAEAAKHLATLRDEMRLELHLAGMEAREGWKKLEPRVRKLETKMREKAPQ